MSEVWNSVTVFGPASEIRRFKRLCVAPSSSGYKHGQSGWDGCDCTISIPPESDGGHARAADDHYFMSVWNFQQFTTDSTIKYAFSFDTDHEFPVDLFECLATRFPKLSFDCDCIEATDDFMGFGWFNPPAGGETFRQNFDVPDDYWTGGRGYKRSAVAQEEHEARIVRLKNRLA